MYAETFKKRTFLGGPTAGERYPVGAQFTHRGAIWTVYNISDYWDNMLLFYCHRVRSCEEPREKEPDRCQMCGRATEVFDCGGDLLCARCG